MAIKSHRVKNLKPFRKLSYGCWENATEASIYGTEEYSCLEVQNFLDRYNKFHNTKLTTTHLIIKLVAQVIQKHPSLNRYFRLFSIYQREKVSCMVLVNLPDKSIDDYDLDFVRIEDVNSLSLENIRIHLANETNNRRSYQGNEFWFVRFFSTLIPLILIKPLFKLYSFLNYGLNLNLKFLGLPNDIAGSFILSNLAQFHILEGRVPLIENSRCPIIITMGEIRNGPTVINNQLVIAPLIKITVTLDHRLIDASQGALIFKCLKKMFDAPNSVFTEGSVENS
ncbi:MAG: 2-oxo acid dehydrogenase subunit E2 [Bacteriovoracaceae bacterium]